MARIDTLTNFLTDVADSIRTKTNKTDNIHPKDFDTEIVSITTGVVAYIKVTTAIGALLTCDDQVYQLESPSMTHTFAVPLGIHTITSTFNNKTVTEMINVDIAGIYEVLLTFSRVPTDYQEVEYLRATGTQYLKLNFTPNDFDDFKSSFIIEGRKPIMDLFGASGSTTAGASESKVFRVIESGSEQGGAFDIAFGNSWVIAQTRTFFEIDTKYLIRGTMKSGKQQVYVNGVKVLDHSVTYENFTNTNLMLFNLNYGGTAGTHNGLIGEVFETTFKARSKEYILVPCYRKSDNKPGMYDVRNNVFYTNEGTGEFEVGGNV